MKIVTGSVDHGEIAKMGEAMARSFSEGFSANVQALTKAFEQLAENIRRDMQELFDEQRQLVAELNAAPWYSRIRDRWALRRARRWAK